MKQLKISVAQFEPHDGDKTYNLSRIEALSAQAHAQDAEVVSFHEMSITAYTFFKDLSLEQVRDLAEPVPDGPSVQRLIQIAKSYSSISWIGRN